MRVRPHEGTEQEELIVEIVEEARLFPRRLQRTREPWNALENSSWKPLSLHSTEK
jgi:hypothetical protein